MNTLARGANARYEKGSGLFCGWSMGRGGLLQRRSCCLLWRALICVVLVQYAACTPPPKPIKRSFFGQGADTEYTWAGRGLDPLGQRELCTAPRSPPAAGEPARILVAAPERFTPAASAMILALHGIFSLPDQENPVRFLRTPEPLRNHEDALAWGQRCGALAVLWEPLQKHTLELTAPYPPALPLRESLPAPECALNSLREQMYWLYLQLSSMLAARRKAYDQAVFLYRQARRLQQHCSLWGDPLPGQTPLPER